MPVADPGLPRDAGASVLGARLRGSGKPGAARARSVDAVAMGSETRAASGLWIGCWSPVPVNG
jgi:hypothetical protein